jgi:hypothetical protein
VRPHECCMKSVLYAENYCQSTESFHFFFAGLFSLESYVFLTFRNGDFLSILYLIKQFPLHVDHAVPIIKVNLLMLLWDYFHKCRSLFEQIYKRSSPLCGCRAYLSRRAYYSTWSMLDRM